MRGKLAACSLAAVVMIGCSGADTAQPEITRSPAATSAPAASEPIGTADGGVTSTPAAAPVPGAPAPGGADAALGAPADPLAGAARITVSETRDAITAGNALVVDVRSAQAFAEGHIPGSINIPLDQLPSRLAELPRDKQIITYCT